MDKQKSTKYKPTEKEKNLLEVLINPDYRMKSITDIVPQNAQEIHYTAFKPSLWNYMGALKILLQSIAPG